MDEYRKAAFEALLSSCTEHRTDRQRALIAFQACQNDEEREFVREFYLRKREAWIDWHACNQRKWQSTTAKAPQRGRNHDSWATRESYIRCSRNYRDFLPYAHSVREAYGLSYP